LFKKIIILFALILISGISPASKSIEYVPADVLKPGEQLIYKVKYFFLRVGTLRLVNLGIVEEGALKGYFKLRIKIDSSPGIPFVTIHDIYETYVDSNAVPAEFHAWEQKGKYTLETDYIFRNDENLAVVQMRKVYPDRVEIVEDKQLPIDRTYRDVLALLYFARQKSSENYRKIIIPTFALGTTDSCWFNEVGSIRTLKYRKEKLPCYYIQGRVKFIGVAGIKDDFEGWFSGDESRVPLKAKMKAFFGSVTIELESSENWLAAK